MFKNVNTHLTEWVLPHVLRQVCDAITASEQFLILNSIY